jgi:hypothetical protein
MSEPTPEQVDALSKAMRAACSSPAIYRDDVAHAILTTTDPDAQAALAANLPTEVMLAELVNRGALTRDTAPAFHRSDGSILVRYDLEGRHEFEAERFVTPWQKAPDV